MRSRERCQCGRGRMMTYSTKTRGSRRISYLKCNACGRTGKEVASVDDVGRSIFVTTPGTNRTNHSCGIGENGSTQPARTP
ncbi:hypothetical protein Poly41_37750 [Novipirellula artificiosorum]|uniref:Uncharacterized protein n=1 Tax=Novipirellula artificiosorum TaxID=2528016 RepID=A0A5C6DHK1_9BACT|nr:hypothetical protein Poly41_37750 [Novipirellula artificiosorum]